MFQVSAGTEQEQVRRAARVGIDAIARNQRGSSVRSPDNTVNVIYIRRPRSGTDTTTGTTFRAATVSRYLSLAFETYLFIVL